MSEKPHTILFRNACVVAMDDTVPDYDRADILVAGTDILQVGPDLAVEADEVVDASGLIALPGLIDAHNHVWETLLRGLGGSLWLERYFKDILPRRQHFRAEDLYTAGNTAGYEMLFHGTTTVMDFCHNLFRPGSAEASITGLADTGVRSVFAYNIRAYPGDEFRSREHKMGEAREMFDRFHQSGGMTGIAIATNETFVAGFDRIAEDFAFARDLGVPITFHSVFSSDITGYSKAGLLGPDVIAVHGNLLTDDELDMMAEARSAICFTPSIDIYGLPADVIGRARKRGVPVAWGCDVPAKVGSDLLAQMRAMFHLQGYLDGVQERHQGRAIGGRRPNKRKGLPSMTARETLAIATIESARILGMDQWIGSIAPGKRADLVFFSKGLFGANRGDPCEHILLRSGTHSIDTVMVNGRIRKRGGVLLDFDAAAIAAQTRASCDHILAQKLDPAVAYAVSGGGEFFDE